MRNVGFCYGGGRPGNVPGSTKGNRNASNAELAVLDNRERAGGPDGGECGGRDYERHIEPRGLGKFGFPEGVRDWLANPDRRGYVGLAVVRLDARYVRQEVAFGCQPCLRPGGVPLAFLLLWKRKG